MLNPLKQAFNYLLIQLIKYTFVIATTKEQFTLLTIFI